MKLFTVGVTGTQSGMNPEHMRSWEGVLYVVWNWLATMWLTILIMGSVGSKKIMFGAVPASLILSLAKSDGVMSQLQLDLGCPPWVFVDPELLTSCVAGFSVVGGDGESTGVSSSEDHPRFRDTRQWLANKGYIDMVTTWHNGDTVLKPFYFNNVFKQVGDSFMCAAAMQRSHTELYNHGEPLPVPNIVIKQPSQPVWDDSYTVTEVGFPDHFDAVKDEQDDLI